MTRPAGTDDRCTVIESISVANPPFSVSQAEAAEFMMRTEGLSSSLRKRIPQVYEKSGICRRYSCLEDYTRQPSEFEFYPQSATLRPTPTTAARNAIYQRESVKLAVQSALQSLQDSGTSPSEVSHVVVVTCTGFFAPGIDILLIKHIGLSASVKRTVIGFMGCCAAFNGLQTANNICSTDSDAVVLLVCIELCTLHFQIENSLESVVVNALFSDGAASCIIRSRPRQETLGKLVYRDGATVLNDESLDAMSWAIGDTGFEMGLSPRVPELISDGLPSFVESILNDNCVRRDEVTFWAVHPGGRQVLDRTATSLGLSETEMLPSYSVLRDYGNMSSPTILFILNRIMELRETDGYGLGVALAFGPGLTMEGCLLELSDAAPLVPRVPAISI